MSNMVCVILYKRRNCKTQNLFPLLRVLNAANGESRVYHVTEFNSVPLERKINKNIYHWAPPLHLVDHNGQKRAERKNL